MQLQQGEKWSYDSYHIISKRRVENSYDPCIHETRQDIEKLENGGKIGAQDRMEIETPHATKKGLKRGSE